MGQDEHKLGVGSMENLQNRNITRNYFDFHFKNYKSLSIKDTDPRFTDSISTITINDVNVIDSLNITCNENSHITLPIDADVNKVTSKISFQVDDIYNKYAIGSISYFYDDEFVGMCTLEGRNIDVVESIYTSHLNLSSPLNEDDLGEVANNNNLTNRSNFLIHRNSNGTLIISTTLITVIVVIVLLVLLIAIIFLLYVYIFSNAHLPINKIKFRVKRNFK